MPVTWAVPLRETEFAIRPTVGILLPICPPVAVRVPALAVRVPATKTPLEPVPTSPLQMATPPVEVIAPPVCVMFDVAQMPMLSFHASSAAAVRVPALTVRVPV